MTEDLLERIRKQSDAIRDYQEKRKKKTYTIPNGSTIRIDTIKLVGPLRSWIGVGSGNVHYYFTVYWTMYYSDRENESMEIKLDGVDNPELWRANFIESWKACIGSV